MDTNATLNIDETPVDALVRADDLLSILLRSLFHADEIELDEHAIAATIETVQERLALALKGLGYRYSEQNGRPVRIDSTSTSKPAKSTAGITRPVAKRPAKKSARSPR